jgi:hypothetical protein
MSRWVDAQKAGVVSGQQESAAARIVKYIPAEVVATFTLVYTALVSFKLVPLQAKWGAVFAIVLFLIATIAYVAMNTTGSIKKAHLIVSPLAFLAWSYPIASAMLGDFFLGFVAFILQALVLFLSIFIVPK